MQLGYFTALADWASEKKKLEGREFAKGPGDLGSIPGRIIPKTFKMVLDTYLLNTLQSWDRT